MIAGESGKCLKKVKGITFYGKGSYSLDFSNIDKGNIKIDKSQNSISITLPKPIVEDVTIYEEKTVYETTTNGLLRFGDIKLSPEQTISISKEVKKLMKDKMVEDELYSSAETNAKSSIEKLLRPLFPNESTIINIYLYNKRVLSKDSFIIVIHRSYFYKQAYPHFFVTYQLFSVDTFLYI